ncbi:ParB/RepB/Spo0J family partition protein (plasmid) [Pseudoduganella sp. UC29_106]|uniref:ParB/RepB/Spo0J family partition protein n=1 Tax=Pseudoduganella sp. UC29_106 TaxID=3374553 RepID=UPI003757BD75
MIQRRSIANARALTETPLIVRLLRSQIHLDPNQPRSQDKHTPETLAALAATMKSEGQQQAIKVRPHPDIPDDYMLVFGEGRWLAAGIGEIEYLDCIITEESNIGKIRVMQITENLQRQDMSQYDTAKAFRELIDLGECENAAAVARRFGMSDATVKRIPQGAGSIARSAGAGTERRGHDGYGTHAGRSRKDEPGQGQGDNRRRAANRQGQT